MGAALPVLSQDCSTCQLQRSCWRKALSPRQKVINLLVCRMQRGIRVNASTRLLLEMIRPKTLSLAMWMLETVGFGDIEDYACDLESVAVESLLRSYVVGDVMHPLRWLFNQPNGAVTRYVAREVNRIRRDAALTSRANGTDIGGMYWPEEYDTHADDRERVRVLWGVVEDGVTLSLDEYRVLRFVLAHADERSLHVFLAGQYGRTRQWVTSVYASAIRAAIDAAGLGDEYIRAKGIEVSDAARKRRRARRTPGVTTPPLTAEEAQLLQEQARGDAGPRPRLHDLAWAFGVHESKLYAKK